MSTNYKPGRYPLGPRLRAVRKAQGMSQDELGNRAGLSGAMVSMIERGIHRTVHIVEIAVALDVDPRWLALGLGKPPLLSPINELRRHNGAADAAAPARTIETAAKAAQRIWSSADIRDWDNARAAIRKRA